MKEIKLSQGMIALVDDDDYEKVNQHKWYARKNGKNDAYYALRWDNCSNKHVRMHRALMEVTSELIVDHVNHNTLDNRKSNLRICNKTENCRNQRLRLQNTSGYKGVSYHKNHKKYEAKIKYNGKRLFLGYYETAKEAAISYNEKAKELFKEFAWINPIEKVNVKEKN